MSRTSSPAPPSPPRPGSTSIYRTRLAHTDLGARMVDTTANIGAHTLNVSGGYLYTSTDPYSLYDTPSPTGQ